MSPLYETLKRAGARLHQPATEEHIRSIELRYDIVIPPGARQLYMEANGADGEFGSWSWNFWPVDATELRLSDYFKHPRAYVVGERKIDPSKYLRFFDVLIDAPLYAYCADTSSMHYGEVLAIYSDNGTFESEISARSASSFLDILAKTETEESLIFE